MIEALGTFAAKYRDLPTLGFTHLQPAQPTTVGRRACLWAYDLVLDLAEVEHRLARLGSPQHQGDHRHAGQLSRTLRRRPRQGPRAGATGRAKRWDFDATYAVTGQTYPRKVDAQIVDALAGIAASAHKGATDLRLLANRKEIEEPFEKNQIGSSAMAYKRNPMRSERICGLARFAMSLQSSTSATLATQWMERTLDDSANRRLVLPQAFWPSTPC